MKTKTKMQYKIIDGRNVCDNVLKENINGVFMCDNCGYVDDTIYDIEDED